MATTEFDTFAALLAGQYSLEREIGRGGMGVVYLGRDLRLDRPVAIKTLPPHLANDAQIRERFLREARTAAALSHPNIVPIYRADEIDGHVFFVMGYVDGEALSERVTAHGQLDPREVLRELRDVAFALGYANARGVVHRDVKAENILIERATGRAMVTDFGIARLAEASPLTATGQVLGTVYYMSPEQVAGESLDGRSDLYSLGVVGFLALTGRFPFDSQLASAVLVAQVNKAPPPVLTISVNAPRALAEIIDRCLAKEPNARFQSGTEMADALTRVEGEVARDAVRAPVVPEAPALLSDDEARAIWKRAADLQALTGVQPRGAPVAHTRDAGADASRTSGYDVRAVRAAAEEAGIPAQYVEHAMAERGLMAERAGVLPAAIVVRDLKPQRNALAGGPMHVEFEAVIPGEVVDRDFDYLADTIRRRLGEAGAIAGTSRSLTWNSLNKQRSLHVTVYARAGKTTVRAVETMGTLAGALFGGIMGGAGGGMTGVIVGLGKGVFHSGLAVIPLEAGWLVAMYVLARAIFERRSKARKEVLRELVDELAAEVRDSNAAGSASPALPSGRTNLTNT